MNDCGESVGITAVGESRKGDEGMNEIIVGVKQIAGAGLADADHPPVGAVNTVFVLIDGVEVPGMVKWTKCETSAEFMEVTISFIASEYRTVSHLEKERFLLNKSAG